MIKSLGVQLFTIRDYMKDAGQIRESFRKLKELGYDEGQTAGCSISAAEFGQIAKETGIKIVGTHSSFEDMLQNIDKVMEEHRALGTTNIGVGGMPGQYFSSVEGIKEFIRLANSIADTIYEHGFKFTYHNHSGEFRKLDGVRIMDMLADGLNHDKTSFVLDTYWVQHGGGDVIDWMKKLSGRIDILHLKDMGVNEKGPFITEILEGNLNFDGIIQTAEEIGVKYYNVEQDTCPGDPFDSLKISSDNIHARYMK